MPAPTIYSFTLQDDKGVKATVPVYVAYDAATETVAALVGNIAALGGLLDAITDAQIIDCRIIIDVPPDPSWKSAPLADTWVVNGALLTFGQANTKYADSITVPAPAASQITAGKVNIGSGSAFDNFIQALIGSAGIGGSHTVFANSKFSNALNSFRHIDLNLRKRRKQLTKQTTEE